MKEKELREILGNPEKVYDDHELDREEFLESLRDSVREFVGLVLNGEAKILIELNKEAIPIRVKIISEEDGGILFMSQDIEDVEIIIKVVDRFKINDGVEYKSIEG